MRGRAAVLLAMALLALPGAPARAAEDAPEKVAQAAAEKWVALVDADRYADSWKAAASMFKERVTAEQWETAVRAVHEQTGRLASRKLRGAQLTKNLPGAPEGEYVVLLYDSSFEKAKSVTETLVPMKDKDGVWRVSGYYVK